MPVPVLEEGGELDVHFGGQLDHGLDVGKHVAFLILADEGLLPEWLLYVIPDGYQVRVVVLLGGHQLP